MNYTAQRKFLKDVKVRHPRYWARLGIWKKQMNFTINKDFYIVIGGYSIADHVILTTEFSNV